MPPLRARRADVLAWMSRLHRRWRSDATLSFEPDALLAQATAETGLDDFGDESFREPLGVLLGALDGQRERSAMGRVSAHSQVLQLLKNRLLVLLAAYPGGRREEQAARA